MLDHVVEVQKRIALEEAAELEPDERSITV
jgi:hypothetical protein